MNSKHLPYEVRPRRSLKGTRRVPTSKSFANRALVLAALKPELVVLKDLPLSSDVEWMITCLKKIGLEIVREDDGLQISNSFPECETNREQPLELETGDGGTTNRFLLALLARGSRCYQLFPSGKIPERPIDELLQPLRKNGVCIDQKGKAWISVQGPFKTSENLLLVDSKRSTQFATALALALWGTPHSVDCIELETSQAYWNLTLHLLEEFKIKSNFSIPIDFSSASYPIAYALFDGDLLIENCQERDHYQADSIFIEFIDKMGGKLEWSHEGLRVRTQSKLKASSFDCSSCPDLVPTMAFVCSYIDGESELKNIKVLKYKESDRLAEIMRLLHAFDVDFNYDEKKDVLKIKGRLPHDKKVDYTPPEDHRMVMTGYLFQRHNGGGHLDHVEHVQKSFGNFFQVMDD